MKAAYRTLNGRPLPMGTTIEHNGSNFALFSKNAAAVILHLFARAEDSTLVPSFPLNPITNKTGDIWHIFFMT